MMDELTKTAVAHFLADDERFDVAVRLVLGDPGVVEVRMFERWHRVPLEEAIRLRWKLAAAIKHLADLGLVTPDVQTPPALRTVA